MPDHDHLELQVAAVKLWYEGRVAEMTQEDVALRLQEMYPEQGRFDKQRVYRLCQYAIGKKLADKPTPAKLKDVLQVRQLVKRVENAEQFLNMKTSLDRCLTQLCESGRFPFKPEINIVSGNVARPQGNLVSECAVSAAACAIEHLKDWRLGNGRKQARVGVTWGRQLHYIGLTANAALTNEDSREKICSFIPLLGLPIGEHRADTLSSSEIARLLNGNATRNLHGEDKDLQLVPAYFPEGIFEDCELPSLYKLLSIMKGWVEIFGVEHMKSSRVNAMSSAYDVNKCDFIWSSISDYDEPFGMSVKGPKSWVPFLDATTGGTGSAAFPVADCGGIPLWSDEAKGDTESLEGSFRRRWTGIRREHWVNCVEKGFNRFNRRTGMSGAVVFAPTDGKARSLLYALRDGLVNVLVLGVPCAKKLLELLEKQSSV